MRRALTMLAGLLLCVPVSAQKSPNYTLTDYSFSAGGRSALSSPEYQVTSVSVAVGVAATGLSSPDYAMDGSFNACYPPPGEVQNLRFVDLQTLAWDPERSAGDYNLYRDLSSSLTSPDHGECLQWAITETTATDSDPPPAGDGYFYLLTAENRLNEEGTRGFGTSGAERPDSDPCP